MQLCVLCYTRQLGSLSVSCCCCLVAVAVAAVVVVAARMAASEHRQELRACGMDVVKSVKCRELWNEDKKKPKLDGE